MVYQKFFICFSVCSFEDFFFFFLFAIGPQSLNFEEKGEVTVKETFWNKIEYFLELNV